jgi:hypothetical protein
MVFHMKVKIHDVFPEGPYRAVLVNVEEKETKHGLRLMWTFELVENDDAEVVGFTSTSPSSRANAYQWAIAIAGQIDPKLGWGPEDVLGRECIVILETAEDAQGFDKNKVVKVKPLQKGEA